MRELFKSQRLTLIYLVSTILVIALATQIGSRLNAIPIVLLGVVSPMVLALIYSFYELGWRGVKEFLGRPAGFRFGLWETSCAFILPFVLMILSIAIDRGEWVVPNLDAILNKLPILMVLMTGEEFGWRRYAFARLSKSVSFMGSALLVALVWWFWHYPGYLIGMGTPENMPFWLFGLMLVPASLLIAFLYARTQNVYLVIVAHISSNLAFNALPFLPEVTGDRGAFIIYSALLWLMVVPLAFNKKQWSKP